MRANPPGRNRTRPKKIPQGSNAATAPDGHQVRAFPSPMEYISSTDPGGGRMSALFAFKLTLVPFFILALSLAGRRWGSAVSGSPDALAGWAGFFLSTSLLIRLPRTLPWSIASGLAALVAAYLLLPAVDSEASPPGTPSWEIAARMAAAVGMVLLMTALARPLGPRLAGLLVPFPVAATVLTVFTHRYQGSASAIRLLRGLVAGLWTMGIFFLVVAGTVERLGVGASFALAAVADVACNGGSLLALRRIRAERAS